MTKDELKWFFIVQIAIIVLFLATMDCIIRGPMENINEQLQYSVSSYIYRVNKRIDVLSGSIQYDKNR